SETRQTASSRLTLPRWLIDLHSTAFRPSHLRPTVVVSFARCFFCQFALWSFMFRKRFFATKSIEMLHEEMAEDEGRLRRALGPVALTGLGVGAIIGAGIFVMAGRVAANDAGPSIMVSFLVAGFGCALAAMCYAEFAAMVPVAGSAYTY